MMKLRELATEWGVTTTAARNALEKSGAAALCGRKGLAWTIPAEAVRQAEQWRRANAHFEPERAATMLGKTMTLLGQELELTGQAAFLEMRERGVAPEDAAAWGARYTRAVGLLMATIGNLPQAPLTEDYKAAIRRQAETMDGEEWLDLYKHGMLEVSMSLEVSEEQRALAAAFLQLPEDQQRAAAEAERAELLGGAES